jgi:hypothetical protein
MRTKNILSIAALIICGLVCVNSVKAEVPPTQTSDEVEVTVNIKFKPIQSIVVNSVQKTVNLEYNTLQNYQEGVSVIMNDHLEVFSSGGFQVKVKANENFTRVEEGTGTETIPAGEVIVQAAPGNGNTGNFGSEGLPLVSLSSNEQPLIGADTGGNFKFHVTYDNTDAGGNFAYLNKHARHEETSYTATVTYSIVAQ